MLFLTFVLFPQIFESFYRSFFGPRPLMGDHGGRREKTGDGAALCQGDERNGGGKRVPCTEPSCKAPNCKSVGPSSLNPPSTHPPLPYQLTTCSSMPPVRATTESEVQRSDFRPAQLSVLLHWLLWNECTYCIPENENAEPVCYLQWMRKDSVGPYPFFGSSFRD